VESVPQLDDSGANTADRYDWQAAMAAADGFALYLDGLGDDGRLRPDCGNRVLCEWQEDWVLFSGDSVQLVSGKHRDPSAGAYTTVAKLAVDGGLAHLFQLRLITCGGEFDRAADSGFALCRSSCSVTRPCFWAVTGSTPLVCRRRR
jgi:hypothetical protein